jgi:hypothetical protein
MEMEKSFSRYEKLRRRKEEIFPLEVKSTWFGALFCKHVGGEGGKKGKSFSQITHTLLYFLFID